MNGTFPNDGYDYSVHFKEDFSSVNMLINEDYEDPTDIKLENLLENDEDMEDDEEALELKKLQKFISSKTAQHHDFTDEEEAERLAHELFDEIEDDEIYEEFGEIDYNEIDDDDARGDFDNMISNLVNEEVLEDEEDHEFRLQQLKVAMRKKIENKIPNTIETEYEESKRLLDEDFDLFFDQYRDEMIGQLDDMDIPQRELEHDDIKRILSEFQFEQEYDHFRAAIDLTHDQDVPKESVMRMLKKGAPEGYYVLDQRAKRRLKENDLDRVQIIPFVESRMKRIMEEDPDNENTEVVEIKVRDQFDCESIISTFTNTLNHPELLEEELTEAQKKKIKLSKKTGMPLGVFDTKSKAEEPDVSTESAINLGAKRSKNESKEEKKLRKQLLKELKKERREAKKQLKGEFKKEELSQKKADAVPESRQKVRFHF